MEEEREAPARSRFFFLEKSFLIALLLVIVYFLAFLGPPFLFVMVCRGYRQLPK